MSTFRADSDHTRGFIYCSTIKFPYPETTYCDVPSEAKTGAPMCRPLRRQVFPSTAPPQESPGVAQGPSPSSRSPPLAASPPPVVPQTTAREYMALLLVQGVRMPKPTMISFQRVVGLPPLLLWRRPALSWFVRGGVRIQ
jgi:hypothetical protein